MEIVLNKEEQEKLLDSILCNGLSLLGGNGLSLDYDENLYFESRKWLQNPCFEDVLNKMLQNGNSLKIIDHEGGEYTKELTLDVFKEGIKNIPSNLLLTILEERDDAWDNFNALQYILYKELIFG